MKQGSPHVYCEYTRGPLIIQGNKNKKDLPPTDLHQHPIKVKKSIKEQNRNKRNKK